MIRLSRRSRFGPALLASTLLGLGSAAGLVTAPHSIAAATPDEFSCRASVLDLNAGALHLSPIVANNPNDPCRSQNSTPFLHVPLSGTDHIDVADAQTVDHETFRQPSSATADARVLEAQVGGTLLRAQVLTAHAEGTDPDGIQCPGDPDQPPTFSGDSQVAAVSINGNPVPIPINKSNPAHPTLEIPGVLKLWLREEIGSASTGITERALELQALGTLQVVISEASVGLGAHPNSPPAGDCTPTPKCSDTPEGDPFVDPTADATRGQHPDCVPEFSEPQGDGDNTARDLVNFGRSINDNDSSPDHAFTPVATPPGEENSRDRFNGKAGFFEDGDTMPRLEGDFYDDEDMHFRLSPLTIDAFFAPDDLAASPWRRFCGTGMIIPFQSIMDGPGEVMPNAPFETGQVRKFLVEAFDGKALDETRPGGDQSDYWVIDIYSPNSNFDTKQCDPSKGGHDHDSPDNPNRNTLDYHSEGQTIEGNIEIHTERVAELS